jgi:hypothetical protein
MMVSVFRICVLMGFIIANTHSTAQTSDEKDGFVLVKEGDGIFIYERWVTFPKSKPAVTAREVKGVFEVKTTISEAIGLMQDEKKIYQWQKHVSEFKVYRKADSTTWEEYSYHDIPWPVSDQDHYLVYKIDPSSTVDKVLVTFESKVNSVVAPIREDVDRMTLSGSWLFEKIPNNKIKVSYSIISMPSHIPRIFTDPVIRSNMMSTIRHYTNILEKRE